MVLPSHCAQTTLQSDFWGNRLSIEEPNAGLITSEYNKFNELVTQTDARGNITNYQYDKLGRVTTKQFIAPGETPQTITYTYDGSNGKGKIAKIKIDGTEVETFTYDNLSRLAEHKKIIDGSSYKHKYTYNKNGQLETLTYPSGFAVTYKYTLAGELKEIRQSSDNTMIYEVAKRNKYHSPTICNYGNGLTTGYGYNPYGLTTYITTGMIDPILIPLEDSINIGIKGDPILITDGYIQHFSYEYDNKGLMVSRSEKRVDLEDLYKYDLLDRLTVITSGKIGKPGTKQMFTYAENGNIKSGAAGTYLYKSKKPHAVTEISASTSDFIENHVEYNFYNQPTKITGEEYELELSYGADQQRQKMEISKEGRFQNKYYYISKYYEREKGPKYGIDRHYHYIYGDNGVVALHTRANLDSLISATDSVIYPHERGDMVDIMYYIHTDHLGSYCTITNAEKEVRQRNFFDAWGNVVEEDANSFPITLRGFTGHEHYPYFKIINMNGRLYDPVIGRFFSPDNFVQIPEFTQSFNRYSYALNCPLMYVDPTGWLIDDYFDVKGKFLYRDDKQTDNIWIVTGYSNAVKGDNGKQMNIWDYAIKAPIEDFSLSKSAILNIINHYDKELGAVKGKNSEVGFRVQSLKSTTLMRQETRFPISIFGMQFGNINENIIINNFGNRLNKNLNTASNIKNSLVHEYKHVPDNRIREGGYSKNEKEIRAIEAQKAHPTYLYTTPEYKKMIDAYEKFYR